MRQRFLAAVVLSWLVCLAPFGRDSACAHGKKDVRQQAAAAFFADVQEHSLTNGLRIFLKPIADSPIVCVMTAYRVGSADEELEQTGLSHYLEHLMFKGTDKLLPGDIDKKTRRAGGQNNAYTTQDFTNFHFEFAADRWETALEIEADRMRNLRIDARHEFEQEKGAVISELDGAEDEPWDLEHKAMLPLLFGANSPYGHPIIGEKLHVRAATAPLIKAHYDRWYHPNNANIIIVGGFDPVRALARIQQLFAALPKGALPPRKSAVPMQRTTPVYKEFKSKFDVDRMLVGFNTVRMGEPEDYVLDVIEGVLASGKTGRLYRRLVIDQELAAEITCSNLAGRLPGWFSIEMEVLNGVSPKKAEQGLLDELRRLATEPVADAEMKRVKRKILSSFVFNHEGVHELADSIANAVALNGLGYVRTYFEKLDAITPQDVQDVARRLLDPQKRIVVCSKAQPNGRLGCSQAPLPSDRVGFGKFARRREPTTSSASSVDFGKVRRVVLPNGLTVLLWENRRLPIFLAEAYVKNARLHEPADKAGVAALVGTTLEEGTQTRTEKAIAEAIEEVGGSLSFSTTGGQVKVLAPDAALGIDLLLDCLIRPKFASAAVRRWREHLQAELDTQATAAASHSEHEFLRKIYGAHPLGRSEFGTTKTLKFLTEIDCRNFHRRVYVPNNVVVVLAGDFAAEEVIADIKNRTSAWKAAEIPPLNLPEAKAQAQFEQHVITMATSAQVNVNLGHVGVRRGHPDYYKLLVMDNIFGIGTGFTDRLSAQLRDRHGLAYEVSASITATAGVEPGVFKAYVGTYADKFLDVKKMLIDELQRFRSAGPTDEEVADARAYLIGSFPFRVATLHDVAGELLTLERFGLGFDYFQRFQEAIGKVTRADVHAAAKTHLNPDKMILVAVGPIDKTGQPLKKP